MGFKDVIFNCKQSKQRTKSIMEGMNDLFIKIGIKKSGVRKKRKVKNTWESVKKDDIIE